MNVGWVQLTGYSAVDCEGKTLSSFFNTCKDIHSLTGFNQFQRLIKVLQSDGDTVQHPSDFGNPPVPVPSFNRPYVRDCHAPSCYEVANVRIGKKSSFPCSLAPLSDPNLVATSDAYLSSSPNGVDKFPSRLDNLIAYSSYIFFNFFFYFS